MVSRHSILQLRVHHSSLFLGFEQAVNLCPIVTFVAL